ncbi:hypothetical protein HanHA300_Chr13g0482001 [Helianthus annuus]|nr:hypothetical protein HanHA300_Chr13g0482001 [Helianthus annuus]KAJ0497682.1 hypothetical protein HanHA89_Chr13g0514011 [Helianthus annuus]KAJ0663688.1 hypothetical protein HanLR1_Chr13g0483901 [Helianthus annuus]KAJ0671182.1 hypothetical protein HanOQP8_Chr13g0482791 [Helianthus annuus]
MKVSLIEDSINDHYNGSRTANLNVYYVFLSWFIKKVDVGFWHLIIPIVASKMHLQILNKFNENKLF